MNDSDWLEVCGEADAELASRAGAAVQAHIERGEYKSEDVRYVERLRLSATGGDLNVRDQTLEKLRRLCSLWDADITIGKIESHRPIIGPIIVAVKKALLPMMRVLLKEQLRKQRDFNAVAITLLAELAHEVQSEKLSSDK